MAIIWAESRIGDRPLPVWIINRLIIFPFIRVGCVIHPDLEVLRTAKEEVAVVRELSRVTSRVVVDDFIGWRARDHVLRHISQIPVL